MSLNIDMWFALSPRVRVLCWLVSAFSGLLLIWWVIILPAKDAQARVVAQQTGQWEARQAQWRKLRTLTPPSSSVAVPKARDFSPLDFQAQGRQLIRWQPAQGGGELMLETRWQTVVETFPLLAERDMMVPAFSLVTHEGALHFTLQLERDDDR